MVDEVPTNNVTAFAEKKARKSVQSSQNLPRLGGYDGAISNMIIENDEEMVAV